MKQQPLTDEQKVLVEKNIRLVYWVVKRRSASRVISELGREEAAQWGMVGLIMAAGRFDPARGNKFSTYACHWIWATIQFHATTARTIRHPHSCYRDLAGTGKLDDLLTIANEESESASLRMVMDEENDPSRMIDAETLLLAVNERERMVLILRALDYSFRSIASFFGCSHQNIEQSHIKAMQKIRYRFKIHIKRINEDGRPRRARGPRGAQPIGRVGDVEQLRAFMSRLGNRATLTAAVATA